MTGKHDTPSPRARRMGILLMLLLGLPFLVALLLPILVSLEPARQAVEKRVSGALHAETSIAALKLRLLPRPRVDLERVRIDSEAGSANIEQLSVFPRIIPLLTGTVTFSLIEARKVQVLVPGTDFGPNASAAPLAGMVSLPARLRQQLSKLPVLPGSTEFRITGGRVDMETARGVGQRLISGLDATIIAAGRRIVISTAFDTDPAKGLRLDASLDGDTRSGELHLVLPRLDPAVLSTVSPDAAVSLSGSPIDLELTTRLEPGSLQTSIGLNTDRLHALRRGRQAVYTELRVDGTLTIDPGGFELTFRHIRSATPSMDLAGSMLLEPGGGIRRVTLEARRAGLSDVAENLRFWGVTNAALDEVFSILKQGDLSAVRLSAATTGSPPTFAPAGFNATGTLADGTVVLPLEGLTLHKVHGAFRLSEGRLTVTGLAGELEHSTVSKADLTIDLLNDNAPVDLRSTIDVDLAEALRILGRLPLPADLSDLLAGIRGLRGRTAGTLDLTGPLEAPVPAFVLGPAGVLIDHRTLPGPLSLPTGRISLSADTLAFTGLELQLLDAELQVAGRIQGDPVAPKSLDLRLDGRLGDAALAYLDTFRPLPEDLKPNAPLRLSDVVLRYEKPGVFQGTGTITAPGRATARFDVALAPGRLGLERLEITDGDAKGLFRATIDDEQLEVAFRGALSRETLEKFLRRTDQADRFLRGDMRFRTRRSLPFQASLEGGLHAENLHIPYLVEPPPRIDRLDIEGLQAGARVLAEGHLAGSDLSVEGTVGSDDSGFVANLDVQSPDLDLAALADLRVWTPPPAAAQEGSEADSVPALDGSIRVRAEKAHYGKRSIEPLAGIATLKEGRATLRVDDSAFCGISTTGSWLRDRRGAQSLDLTFSATQQDLNATYRCLLQDEAKIKGTYTLTGHVEGRGDGAPMADTLRGTYRFLSRKGRVYKAGFFTELLATLNLTELLRGRSLEIGRDGLPYDTWLVEGRLEGKRLHIEHLVFAGSTLKIAGEGDVALDSGAIRLTLLVSPLRTVDAALGLIPLVGTAAKENLLSVGVRVRGSVGHPKTSIVPASSIGGGVLGTMKNILKIPFSIFEPAPGEK